MLRRLKRFARLCLDMFLLPVGWVAYGMTGHTPQWAGQSFVRLFCVSAGYTNDLMAFLVSMCFPPLKLEAQRGVLPVISSLKIAEIASVLRDRGFFVFEQRVPEATCERLLEFALTHPALLRPSDGQERKVITAVYDPKSPRAVRYDFQQEDLINYPEVQKLMADPTLISVAQSYLKTEPIADVIAMWWHTAYSDRPDSEAAQFYHFDMDRIKWLKFFIYLTDVAPENGPHYFIAESHRTRGIPPELLSKGYARLLDEEVAAHYRKQDFVEFSAPRGTIIAEDTRGLHKGQHVHRGHRLVLQIQFSNSLFGPEYPKTSFAAIHDPMLTEMLNRSPRIYSNYLPASGNGRNGLLRKGA